MAYCMFSDFLTQNDVVDPHRDSPRLKLLPLLAGAAESDRRKEPRSGWKFYRRFWKNCGFGHVIQCMSIYVTICDFILYVSILDNTIYICQDILIQYDMSIYVNWGLSKIPLSFWYDRTYQARFALAPSKARPCIKMMPRRIMLSKSYLPRRCDWKAGCFY